MANIESIGWKLNVPTKGIDPEDAYKALEEIRSKNNGLTDDAIVEAAKSKRHVLHGWFEWDDSAAASEHRRHQARSLIRSLVVTYAKAPELKVRAYQVEKKAAVKSPERTVYSTTEEVLRNPESRNRLIAQAIREAMEFRQRFKHLHELDMIFEAIDRAEVQLGVGE